MNDDERLMALHAFDLLSGYAYRINSAEDADKCLSILHDVSGGCRGEYSMVLDIIREHILRKMQEVWKWGDGSKGQEGVYAIEFEGGVVKIGRTSHFSKRLKTLSNQSTLAITGSRFFKCVRSSTVESMAHRNFAEMRLKNEFFNVPLAVACDFLNFAADIDLPETAVN